MLTPAFEISQDNDFVIINIKVPFAKISETEIFYEDYNFSFYSKPYFLRLNLPGKVVENEKEGATYNADSGCFIVNLPKVNPGEWFEDLDLLTKLLAPPKKSAGSSPLIEVIAETPCTNDDEEEDSDDFDWHINQTLWTEEDEKLLLSETKYGFADLYNGYLSRLQEELAEIMDITEPSLKPESEKRKARLQAEAEYFSSEHYLADLHEDESVQPLVEFRPPWAELFKKCHKCSSKPEDIVSFTEEEKEKMRKLPNKEYLIDKQMKKTLLLGLFDILFGYAYNARTTECENTVESAWTIRKLSSTLSRMDKFQTAEEVVVSAIRRSLCYPLYRHWKLALTVLEDVKKILFLGNRYVLKCLLEIHTLFNGTEPYYILNDLYITDYCIWIQSVKSKTLISLANFLEKLKIEKKNVDLDLEKIEQALIQSILTEEISEKEDSSTSDEE